ncbi:FtsX-like permease family protein [Paracoccus sp. S-4012]|uniref:FtsX-like permease family protein n=1 Tax=Paracoccus sp. S-4012 TaxID=2665648 RepID=UPI0012AF2194|nr:FtsX-like permease family protein [Paracoccus sp. S-4012]MRX50367.1 FtsX-like permease family protein [Paracoccus sp. S-4012]
MRTPLGPVLGALMSHWRRRPLQLVLLLTGLTLATALWSGVQAINAEARASYAQAADTLGRGRLERLEPPPGAALTDADWAAARRAGWDVSPLVEGRLRLGEVRVSVLGVEPVTRDGGPGDTGEDLGDLAGPGALRAFITPPGRGWATPETIAGLGPDAPLDLVADPDAPRNTLVVDVGIAQALLGMEGRLTAMTLAPDSMPGLVPLTDLIPGLLRHPPGGGDADPAALTASFHLNLTAFALLSFIVGLFITQSAVGLAFEQRRGLVRTLRGIGVGLGTVLGVMAAELALMALVAGALGVLLGWAMAAALMPGVAATLSGLYGAEVGAGLALRPGWIASGLGMALLGTGIAGARGLVGTARLPLLAGGQAAAWAVAAAQALRWQGIAALALLAAMPLALAWGGLVAGFAAMACALLAAALMLPVVLDAALRLAGRRVRGVLGEWFVADTRQQLSGLTLALMALMLALAANIGVGTMVGSFRATFTGWLDQRLAAELYVTARTEDEAAAVRAFLAEEADAVLPIWSVDAPLGGVPGRVYGIVDHATYRDNWPLLDAVPGVWDRLAAGQGVLVNEQMARRQGLALGDPVDLPGGAQPILGVYSDYGNPRPQAMLGMEDFLARFPAAPRLYQAVRIAPARAPALTDALIERFDLPPGAIVDQARAKSVSLQIFERTFAVTGALNLLTLGVAGIALWAGLTTLAAMRLGQLAPVWASGLPRARLARMELGRTLLLAAGTAVYAVPVGLGLAWMLLSVINVAAFGWRLPMQLQPGLILQLGLAALLTALLAGAWPAFQLARLTPARLLRVFADER